MKILRKIDQSNRAAVKRTARRKDLARLKKGGNPEILQQENSIFPEGFFKQARISNLASAVGR